MNRSTNKTEEERARNQSNERAKPEDDEMVYTDEHLENTGNDSVLTFLDSAPQKTRRLHMEFSTVGNS